MTRPEHTPTSENKYVSRGVAYIDTPNLSEPVQVSFVLVPKFTMLAFTSAIEPLRAANQLSGKNLFEWRVFSETGEVVTASNGINVVPDGMLPKHTPPGYIFVCGGVEPDVTTSGALAGWMRDQWRHGRTIGSLCSGAYILAEAGLLRGRTFTLHWENIPGFREAYPGLEPVERSYCIDNRLITCAGGIASAEIALKLINDHCGAELGQAAMNMCLLTHRRTAEDPQVISIAAGLGVRNEHLVRAVEFIEANLEEGFSFEDCAKRSGVTLRQLQRLFRQHLGLTPAEYRNNTRLRKARILLSETNLPVMEVALACGYNSSSRFAKTFRQKYGVSPYKFSNFR